MVYVYAGSIFRDADEESMDLFDAVKWGACAGSYGGGFDSTWHYAERSGGEEDCDVRSDGK